MNITHDLNEAELIRRLQCATEVYVEQMRKHAAEATADVRECVRALADLPDRTQDLLLDAAAVFVKEIDISKVEEGQRVPIELSVGYGRRDSIGDMQPIAGGRYRIVCAFVRLPPRAAR